LAERPGDHRDQDTDDEEDFRVNTPILPPPAQASLVSSPNVTTGSSLSKRKKKKKKKKKKMSSSKGKAEKAARKQARAERRVKKAERRAKKASKDKAAGMGVGVGVALPGTGGGIRSTGKDRGRKDKQKKTLQTAWAAGGRKDALNEIDEDEDERGRSSSPLLQVDDMHRKEREAEERFKLMLQQLSNTAVPASRTSDFQEEPWQTELRCTGDKAN
jgi:hypothetical protein